jgi:hypothetical protein
MIVFTVTCVSAKRAGRKESHSYWSVRACSSNIFAFVGCVGTGFGTHFKNTLPFLLICLVLVRNQHGVSGLLH